MRPRIAVLLAVAVAAWVGWGVFIYHPAPDAMAPCVPNGQLACSTVDGFPLGVYIQGCDGQPGECGANARLALDSLPPWESLHPAVVSSAEYALDMARFCGPVVCSMSGYTIYVFDFADGTRHAIGIVCSGVNPTCQAVQTYTSGA